MTTNELIDFIEELKAAGVTVSVTVSVTIAETGAAAPVPPPMPVSISVKTVTADKANARYASSYNAAGRPIMHIYPSDTAPVSQRVQWLRGAAVEVLSDEIKADGGGVYYELRDSTPYTEVKLYIRKDHVTNG
jgi:hypothetical protein